MKASNWIKTEEKPLEPEIKESLKAITEFKDVTVKIRMFRGSTTLSHNIDEITKAVCDPNARMIWYGQLAI
jgi:hypothetical protein